MTAIQGSLCSRCRLRTDVCVCGAAPKLTASIRVLLLTHEREPEKTTNTGRLMVHTLSHCDLHIWQRKVSGHWLKAEAERLNLQPVLLFPEITDPETTHLDASVYSKNSRILDFSTLASIASPWFIIIDATWQQAGKIVRQTPELQALPRLPLEIDEQSRYLLRKNQQLGQVSTVETGIFLLKKLGYREEAECLNDYFQRFLQHYEAHRSGHKII